MPNYEYKCSLCETKFVRKQDISDDHSGYMCPCGHRATRIFTAVPVHYKGTGFYTTDYKGR